MSFGCGASFGGGLLVGPLCVECLDSSASCDPSGDNDYGGYLDDVGLPGAPCVGGIGGGAGSCAGGASNCSGTGGGVGKRSYSPLDVVSCAPQDDGRGSRGGIDRRML